MGQWIHVFLFILNQIYLAAKSIVSRGSLLFKRLLITDCVSSKWELKAWALILLAFLWRKIRTEDACCLDEGWEASKWTFSWASKGGPWLIQAKGAVSEWWGQAGTRPWELMWEGALLGGGVWKHFSSHWSLHPVGIWKLHYGGILSLHKISVGFACSFASREKWPGDFLVKKWVVPFCLPTASVGLHLKLGHHGQSLCGWRIC